MKILLAVPVLLLILMVCPSLISGQSEIVAKVLVESDGNQIRIETTSLEVASILKMIARLNITDCYLGGEVMLNAESEHGFYFDSSTIMIYHPTIPELSSHTVISPDYDEWPSTISAISSNLQRYARKIAYISLSKIIQYQELIHIRREPQWLEGEGVATTNAPESQPSLIQDSKGVYWVAYTVGGGTRRLGSFGSDIYITKSNDENSWSKPIAVASTPSDEWVPSLLQDHNGTYWIAYRDGYEIRLTHSKNCSDWSKPIELAEGHYPSLYQDSKGTYWIAYMDEEECCIALLHSSDGKSWSKPTRLDNTRPFSWNPSLIQSGDGVYLIAYASAMMEENETLEQTEMEEAEAVGSLLGVFLTKTRDLKTWSTPILVVNGTDEFSFFQDRKGMLWIAFHSTLDDGNLNIFVISSMDGEIWSAPVRVTDDPANDIEPSIIQDDNGRYLVAFASWRKGNYDVFITENPGQTTTTHTTSTTSFPQRLDYVSFAVIVIITTVTLVLLRRKLR